MTKIRTRLKQKRRRKAPKQQYYGGSQERYEQESAEQKGAAQEARDERAAASKELRSQTGRLDYLADEAESDYRGERKRSGQSRGATQEAIAGLSTRYGEGEELRNKALAANDANAAAARAITENEAVTAARLRQSIDAERASAMGLAGGMGEGGALAMQQAVASSGVNAGQLSAVSNTDAAANAAALRAGGAQQQIQNALTVADVNATQRAQLGQATLAGQQGLQASDLAAQQAAAQREMALRSGSMGGAQAAVAGALSSRQTELGGSQNIELGQLGQNVDFEKQRQAFEASRNPFGKAVSTVFDPYDIRGSGQRGVI